jgi:hypothetical protein
LPSWIRSPIDAISAFARTVIGLLRSANAETSPPRKRARPRDSCDPAQSPVHTGRRKDADLLASGRQASLPCRFAVPPPRSSNGKRFPEPCVGADVDQCAGKQADSRHPQARALIRVRDELEKRPPRGVPMRERETSATPRGGQAQDCRRDRTCSDARGNDDAPADQAPKSLTRR